MWFCFPFLKNGSCGIRIGHILQVGCNCGSIYIGKKVTWHSGMVRTLMPNMAGFELLFYLLYLQAFRQIT